jgi:iron complex transport system permease protein
MYVRNKKLKLLVTTLLSIVILAFLSILSLSIGASRIGFIDVLKAVIGVGDQSIVNVVWNIRLPRLLSAMLVGFLLSVSGVVMQTLFRNPLIDPYIGGIASGAAFGASLSLLLGYTLLSPSSPYAVPLTSFIGSLTSLLLTLLLSRLAGGSPLSLLLSGIAVGLFFSSATTVVIVAGGEKAHGVVFWLFGSFVTSSWRFLMVAAPVSITAITYVFLNARRLNALLLGDEDASQLGINVKTLRYALLTILSILSALAVSFNGIIGFIGLMAPHISRLIVGSDHRLLLPLSMLIGSVILILADIAARILIAPAELPVGAITSVMGVPIFIHLLLRRGRYYEL